MASTKGLYFEGRRLIADFFSRLKVTTEELISEEGVLISASVVTPDNKIHDIKIFDIIAKGYPHIGILTPFLYLFDDNFSSDDAEILRSTDILEKKSYASWKKDSLLVSSITPEILEKPTPILILGDSQGAFANLCYIYGKKRYCCYRTRQAGDTPQDIIEEKGWESELIDCGYQYKEVGTSTYFCPQDKAADALQTLLNLGWHIEDARGKKIVSFDNTAIQYVVDGDHITIQGSIHFGKHSTTPQAMLSALASKERFISLDSSSVGLIHPLSSGLKPLQALCNEVEIISGTASLPKCRYGLIDTTVEKIANPHTSIILRPLDSNFTGHLRHYQQEGLFWLQSLMHNGFGGILADDMGLGKTVQVIALLATMPENALSLIIVPTSLLANWQNELKCFFPSCAVLSHYGPDRSKKIHFDKGIILTTYGILRSDIAQFSNTHYTAVILDEAQMIKNEETTTAQAVRKLSRSFSLSVTGTPIENSFKELYNQFSFALPNLLKEGDSPDLVYKKIRPFILRRKKEQVAKELPEKIEQTLFIEMACDEREAYEKLSYQFRNKLIKKSDKGTSIEILEAILRLRQFCCHPSLVEQFLNQTCNYSSKFEAALTDIETILSEGKKVILFSQFSSILALFAKEASLKEWKWLLLDGQTKNRQDLVDNFQNGSSSLFLISLKAGGVGLNLTAADYVLIYDPWWNDAVEAQAADRAHRIGRQGAVVVKRYIVKDSIEEKLLALKESKKAVESLYLSGVGPSGFSLDELKELLD